MGREVLDPWSIRTRPRSSMKPFGGAPWNPPKPIDTKAEKEGPKKPAEWFFRYQRMIDAPITKMVHTSGESASNFVQCDLNPGVAYDKRINKFTLLLFNNGVPTEKGRFFTENEGLQAYTGYNDMQNRGPHGIPGVPLSLGNEGPPGVAILPDIRKNYPARDDADKLQAPSDSHWRENKGAKSRPTTALLKDKGQWTGVPPDHSKKGARPDLILAAKPLEER